MSATHHLTTLAQIALLSEEEFKRMLPDFVAWFLYVKEAQKLGATATGFEWCDDGKPYVISGAIVTDMQTGEVHEFGPTA